MNRCTFLRSLLLCAAAPAVVSRALSAAPVEAAYPFSRHTMWVAQTEDGLMYLGRMVWSESQGCFVADRHVPRVVGLAYWDLTEVNDGPQPAPRCYGSLRPYRS